MRLLRATSTIAMAALALAGLAALAPRAETPNVRFSVTYGAGASAATLDGRLLLLISNDPSEEPRLQINGNALKSQQVFGLDVEGWRAGQPAVFEGDVLGFPARSLTDLPAGKYRVQALLHRYETFRRADGHVVQLPMDRGEGQQWSRAPGNLYSTPQEIAIDPAKAETIAIVLDQVIPPIPDPPTTKYVKHEKILTERLSKFWGRPMYLGAHILLPEGFDAHPNARYPLVIDHGHFPDTIGGWREEPPDPNLKPEYSERFKLEGYNRTEQEHAYQFYKDWTAPGYPALPPARDPAREPVLRRLVRGELPERRPLRRRDHVRADSLHREEVPRARRRLGALHVRGLDRGLGSDGGTGLLSR